MNRKKNNSKSAVSEYSTVAIAEDIDLANEYKEILAKNKIPAITTTQKDYSADVIGIAVMVPGQYLDRAGEIIESCQDFDHFLDDAFNDTDDLTDESGLNYFDDDNDLE